MTTFEVEPEEVLERLRAVRAQDAPTRGGRVLSYVYDSGLDALDTLTASAAAMTLGLNGLDPIVFGSIGQMERDVVGFVRELVHGQATGAPDDVVGTVTSGGTESILLAVMTARDTHPGRRTLLAPATRHPAFAKAAHVLGLRLETVPVGADGRVDAAVFADRLSDDVALAVVSAPSYPHGALDPVAAVAAACAARGVDLHVDACFGGLALPFWPGVPAWDFRLQGVTSISADLHKFGYSPKGASVLLHRGRERQRSQLFADTSWPGYPVVTSTLLGSRQPAGLAGAWAAVTALGRTGLASLMASCERSTRAVREAVTSIDGLRVVGEPVGPIVAIATDTNAEDPVDALRFVDALAARGFFAQHQPGLAQPGGADVPRSAHVTITPVTESQLGPLVAAMREAADAVRGEAPLDASATAAGVTHAARDGLDAPRAQSLLTQLGADGALTGHMADLVALAEALPPHIAQRLLIELLAARLEP